MTMLQKRIEALVDQHGGLRPTARVLGIDHVYLWRLLRGEKNNPSATLLLKLKLRRIVEVEYVPSLESARART